MGKSEMKMLLNEAKKILSRHKKDLLGFGVRTLSLFGSVARNKASARSDIDILIEFDARKGIFGFIGLKNYLEELLSCDVDLVTKSALHPALRKRILHEAKRVF
jgi:predicted nucleotidyltransferase